MTYLFSGPGTSFFKTIKKRKLLLAFDYDGTLVPLTKDFKMANLAPSIEKKLILLNHIFGVAIISGRGLHDLNRSLGLKLRYVVGNHGAEGLKIKNFSPKESKSVCKKWRLEITRYKLIKGIEVEDKKFSLSLHYRICVNKAQAKSQLLSLIKNLRPIPRVVPGKSVINLVPSFAPTKGDAVLRLLEISRKNLAVYVGDDTTDEDVFCLKDPRIVGIRVGKKRSSKAKYYIKSRSQIAELLRKLGNLKIAQPQSFKIS